MFSSSLQMGTTTEMDMRRFPIGRRRDPVSPVIEVAIRNGRARLPPSYELLFNWVSKQPQKGALGAECTRGMARDKRQMTGSWMENVAARRILGSRTPFPAVTCALSSLELMSFDPTVVFPSSAAP